jgi:hypothetical protein
MKTTSSIRGSPFQIWIDRACGYTFRQDYRDDQAGGFSFQQDFLPPTHLHEFHFMTDYVFIYCYPHFLGITKEMMSRGPQVADMEYRETDG